MQQNMKVLFAFKKNKEEREREIAAIGMGEFDPSPFRLAND